MNVSFDIIKKDILNKSLAPIYLLHGEESFYTDRLVELFEEYLPVDERTFNLFTVYALEKNPDEIMEIARRFPLMSSKIIIIVKEAQTAKGGAGKWINRFSKYASNPSLSTSLIIVSRGASVSCREFTDAMDKKGGKVFESKKIKDENLSAIIKSFIKEASLNIENDAISLISDNIGNDLSRLYNEIRKLKLILPKDATVTPEVIENNIGISRKYNNFELTNALARRDAKKAISIIRYINANQGAFVLTLSVIFNFFSRILIAYYTPGGDTELMRALDLKYPNALRDYKIGMQNYSPSQIIEIINKLRTADSHAKGNGSRLDQSEIMENLILQILLSTGKIN